MKRFVGIGGDAAVAAFLALLALGAGVLALLGYESGVLGLAWVGGFSVGWAALYLVGRLPRHRGWAYAALGAAVLLPFFVSVFGLARGIGWMVLDLGPDSAGGAFWYGATLAMVLAVFGRPSGRGTRTGG